MIHAEIITVNNKIVDGNCIGGYHECHDIRYLSSIDHLIASIDTIIKNNLKYGCEDTVLESVMIGCNDHGAVDYINAHHDLFNYTGVKVSICISEHCFL